MLTFQVSIPFGGRYVPPEWALSIAHLQFPQNTSQMWVNTKKVKRDLARNTLAEHAIKNGAKYLFFMDDDTQPPSDALCRLYQELEIADPDVVACGGVYTSKRQMPEPLVFKAPQSGPDWKWKVGDVFPCYSIGTGCLLIKTSVFKELPKPWFRDINTREEIGDDPSIRTLGASEEYRMTDDIYFCQKVAQAGKKIIAHGGVLPLHWDQNGKAHFLAPDSPPMRGVDQGSLWYNRYGTLQVKKYDQNATTGR